MPTLVETFSYIFYFPSSVIGPGFEFIDYKRFVNLEGEYENIPAHLAIKTGLIEICKSLMNLILMLLMTPIFNIKHCLTPEYAQNSLIYKLIYFNIAMLFVRSKYYIGFKLAQGCIITSGLGYNPVYELNTVSEKKVIHKFDKIEIMGIREIEFDPNPKRKMQYWNRQVHLWLKYNVFLRLLNVESKLFKNNKSIASLITFMISAFWHGFYLIYYFSFFLFYMLEQVCTFLEEDWDFFNWINNQNVVFKQLVNFFVSLFYCSYCACLFCLISFEDAYMFSKTIYFLPQICLLTAFVLLNYLHKKKRREKYRESKEKEMMKTTPIGDENKKSK